MNTKLNYHILSQLYDLCEISFFSRKKTSPRQALLDFLPEKDIKILDLCTGTGINSILIAEQKPAATVVGIDISKDMLNIANKKISKKKLNNIENIVMNAVNLKFQSKVFDFVIISLVLHELKTPLAKRILREAKRVLKDNGKIIVVEWSQPKSVLQRLMFVIIKLLEPKSFEKFLKLDFYKYFSNNDLTIKEVRNCDYTRIFELV